MFRPSSGAGVGVGPLSANRKTFAMTQSAIATQIHQALDVHSDFTAQIALHNIVSVDRFADPDHLVVG
jgi:hypothetical protein